MKEDKKYDYKKMKSEALFYYMTNLYPDKEYRGIVSLLMYCFNSPEELYSFLEKIIKENRKLVAVYPAYDKIDTSKMEYVGLIPDGVMYSK